MAYTTLIATEELAARLDQPDWAIIDTRFSLDQTERGRRDYLDAHIPGAVYAHLNEDLSDTHIPGQTGRHPLPSVEQAAQKFSSWGIGNSTQVIVYDDGNGSTAARLWWMLRWLGHTQVAVLNGGWATWQKEKRPTISGAESRTGASFVPQPHPELVVDAVDVARLAHDPSFRVFDSRSVERYRGEQEPIDPVAGHVPGAVSAPFTENLDADGRLLPADALASRFQTLLGNVEPEQAIFYCGSGVTAAHNLLALAHAGLPDAKLYAGSWSDWIIDPSRPIEKG